MKSTPKNGFTLIEIILALLVTGIGIVAMIGLLGTSLDRSAQTRDDLNAVSFADMMFNYYHAADWNDIPPDGRWFVPDYNGNSLDLADGTYTCMAEGYAGEAKELYTVSFRLEARQDADRKNLTLNVWSGFNTNTPPRTFYTEIYNWKMQ